MKYIIAIALIAGILAAALIYGLPMVTVALIGLVYTSLIGLYGSLQRDRTISHKRAIKRLKLELTALRRVFWFHETNSDLEKLLALALFTTWSVITIGVAFGYAEATEQYAIITALMWMMIGKMWGGALKDVSSGAG